MGETTDRPRCFFDGHGDRSTVFAGARNRSNDAGEILERHQGHAGA